MTDRQVLIAAICLGVITFCAGAELGMWIVKDYTCPPPARHVSIKTIETPTLILHDGVWMTHRRVAVTEQGR